MPGKHLDNPTIKSPGSGPPRPGLIWNPQSSRWVRPRSGSQIIGAQLMASMNEKDLTAMQHEARTNLKTEKNSMRYNDLSRVIRQAGKELDRRNVQKALSRAGRLARKMAVGEAIENVTILLKGMSIESVIPLEQIKGDLRRAGHTIKAVIALDPEARRIFFMDDNSSPRYCSFSGPENGFAIQNVGFQSEIAKEYNPVDLEPDGDDDLSIATEHEERDYSGDDPGMIPAGTPGEKPENNEQEYEDTGQFGEGLGDAGFSDEERHEGRRTNLSRVMNKLEAMLK